MGGGGLSEALCRVWGVGGGGEMKQEAIESWACPVAMALRAVPVSSSVEGATARRDLPGVFVKVQGLRRAGHGDRARSLL